MGSTISQVKDQHKDDEKEANDALNSLQEVAKTKLELFKNEILLSGTDADRQLPIQFILLMDQSIQCSVSLDGGSTITNGVRDTIGAFASGDFITGITNVLDIGLKAVFSSYNGNSSEKQGYFISVGPTLGFYRIDYYIYSYQFTSESLQKYASNVVCFCYAVSSIDVSTVDLNTLRVVVGYSFGDLQNLDGGDQLLDEMMLRCEAALQTAKESIANNMMARVGQLPTGTGTNTNAAFRSNVKNGSLTDAFATNDVLLKPGNSTSIGILSPKIAKGLSNNVNTNYNTNINKPLRQLSGVRSKFALGHDGGNQNINASRGGSVTTGGAKIYQDDTKQDQ